MTTADQVLSAARCAPVRDLLADHKDAIQTLRDKEYTWRQIAVFLTEHGVQTDHTKVFRFMKRLEEAARPALTSFRVPSASEYATTLGKIAISADQRAMLAFHFKAHNRTVTFTQLARAAGHENFRFANSNYGGLARILGESIGIEFTKDKAKTPFYCSAIGADNPFKPAKGEYELVMHHELAKALEFLGWFA